MRNSKRRRLLKASTLGTLGWTLASCAGTEALTTMKPSRTPLRILILGGTGYIGPHMVRQALSRGHTVTLFNRGKTNPGLFPNVETLIGDRDRKLDALRGREWDAVIDNSGHVPRHVRDSARLLSESAKQYLFISSVSSYADFETLNFDESYPQAVMADPTDEQRTPENYGPMKALCERAVAEFFPRGTTVFRPGFIVGPGDTSDRWTYWPVRTAQGGTMLVPGDPSDPVQLIDVRDLAQFTILALEENLYETFNVTGPADLLTMGEMLKQIRTSLNADTQWQWVDPQFLEQSQIRVPIWASSSGPYRGIHQISNAKAIERGLAFRSLHQTVTATADWWRSLSAERRDAMRAGLRRMSDAGSQELSIKAQLQIEREFLASLVQ